MLQDPELHLMCNQKDVKITKNISFENTEFLTDFSRSIRNIVSFTLTSLNWIGA